MKNLLILWLAVFSLRTAAQQTTDSRQREIVFINVSVIPMTHETVLANQTVLIKNGLITAIGAKLKYDKNALVIDARGKYLMPGLAEMHAHVPPVDDVQPMKDVLQLFAANGVTTIRSMLGHPLHLQLRSQVQSGELLGPRIYTSGPSFSGASIKTPEEAEAKVRSQKKAGYDFMKMHPGITKTNFEAIVKTAKEEKMPFAGHVSFGVGVWRSAEAGYATIDHLDGIVEAMMTRLDTLTEEEAGLFGLFVGHNADIARLDKILKTIKDNGVWIVPTQTLAEHWQSPNRTAKELLAWPEMKYMDKKTLDGWARSKDNTMKNPAYQPASVLKFIEVRRTIIRECQRQGVGLLLGSDAPQVFSVPGFSLKHELNYLVQAGLTPYQALQTGTVNIGKFFRQDNLGVIKPGAVADLVLLNENPLIDVNAVGTVQGVMLNGRWLPKTEIDAMLTKLVKN
ncbi:amidohydrolase family protein [Emticicia sp. 21SJ11W-3]|uniref:amidohydrolase family protein n=1 Tax=Emticicia sp. 21SJ11W-3 TaxID=2916755 RepID=UPI00209FD037|nr:amidohydrolase family protein [Emticicia sp. 21SJ11W-3]UTA67037.1 amidohydrolase family protein [Emticicia sp. 21SJ11W-3]